MEIILRIYLRKFYKIWIENLVEITIFNDSASKKV